MNSNTSITQSRLLIVISLFVSAVMVGCAIPIVNANGDGNRTHIDRSHSDTATETDPHWNYAEERGPDAWGELHHTFSLCSGGTEQSPINVDAHGLEATSEIDFHYQPSDLMVLNNGHTIQANYEPGSYIIADGERFDLLQFHMHAPSEHTIDGQSFPIELHLVHQSQAGHLAVVGLLIEEGAQNQPLMPL